MAKRSPVTSPSTIPAAQARTEAPSASMRDPLPGAEAFSPPAPASTALRRRILQASTGFRGASDSTCTFFAPWVKVRRNTPRVRQRQPQSVAPGLSNPPAACGRAARSTRLPGVGRDAGSCQVQTNAPGSGMSRAAALPSAGVPLAPSRGFMARDFTGAAPAEVFSPSSKRNRTSSSMISKRLSGLSSTDSIVPESTPLGRWSIQSGRSGTAGRRTTA